MWYFNKKLECYGGGGVTQNDRKPLVYCIYSEIMKIVIQCDKTVLHCTHSFQQMLLHFGSILLKSKNIFIWQCSFFLNILYNKLFVQENQLRAQCGTNKLQKIDIFCFPTKYEISFIVLFTICERQRTDLSQFACLLLFIYSP